MSVYSVISFVICHMHIVEYVSQLPTEGGAFYTFDTMDASRPHYRRAWPPILYAISLWLHQTGFTSVDKDDSRPANMKVDDQDVSRFHLLIGICFVIYAIMYYLCIFSELVLFHCDLIITIIPGRYV